MVSVKRFNIVCAKVQKESVPAFNHSLNTERSHSDTSHTVLCIIDGYPDHRVELSFAAQTRATFNTK